jgi:chromosome segregation ATPase
MDINNTEQTTLLPENLSSAVESARNFLTIAEQDLIRLKRLKGEIESEIGVLLNKKDWLTTEIEKSTISLNSLKDSMTESSRLLNEKNALLAESKNDLLKTKEEIQIVNESIRKENEKIVNAWQELNESKKVFAEREDKLHESEVIVREKQEKIKQFIQSL